MEFNICRVCLRINAKVYDFNTFNLKFYYENLIGIQIRADDGLPRCVCYECAALLHKFHKFKEKSHCGLKTLNDLLLNETLSYETVYNLERASLLVKCQTYTSDTGPQNDLKTEQMYLGVESEIEIHIKSEPGIKDEVTKEDERSGARGRAGPRARFRCRRCGYVCALKSTALRHQAEHRGARACPHCQRLFGTRSAYHSHVSRHRGAEACARCGVCCQSGAGRRRHRRCHQDSGSDDGGPEVPCRTCDIRFESRKAYDEHLFQSSKHADIVGDNDGIKDKSMKILGKRLRAKIKKQEDEKGKAGDFDVSVSLVIPDPEPTAKKRGRKKAVKVNARKPTTCYQCGRHFATQDACVRHHRARHPGTSPCAPAARHVCELCGATLAPGSVAGHQNMHSRQKVFPCEACGKVFGSNVGLKRHAVTHTGEKRFPCPLCDKRFTQSNSMKLHYRTFHLKQPYPKRNPRKPKEGAGAPAIYLTL